MEEKQKKNKVNEKTIQQEKPWYFRLLLPYCFCVILVISLCFSSSIERILKLQPNLSILKNQDLEIHFIDVGQGDAIAIRFPNDKTMLVDTGPQEANAMLGTYLNQVFFKGKDRAFEYLYITHSDLDHSGNLAWILQNYEVKHVIRPRISIEGENIDNTIVTTEQSYIEAIHYATEHHISIDMTHVGDCRTIGNVSVRTIGPTTTYTTTNAMSTVLLIEYNGNKILLAGDAEYEQVKDALKEYPDIKHVQLFKIGHHGSKTSLQNEEQTENIFDTIKVDYAVISVGRNSYGHPSVETLQALSQYQVNSADTLLDHTMMTIQDGNIVASIMHDIKLYAVGKTDDYAYVSYWVIVVVIISIILVITFVPEGYRRKYRKSKNQKI